MSRVLDEVRSWPRNVLLLFTASLMVSVGHGALGALFNLYLQEMGFEASLMGDLVSLTSLASAMALIPAGLLTDRHGRKTFMVAGATVGALTQLGRLWTANLPVLRALSLGLGLAGALSMVAQAPFLIENRGRMRGVQVFTGHMLVIVGGGMAGSVLGGWISAQAVSGLGMTAAAAQRYVMTGAAGLMMLSILPLLALTEIPRARRGATRIQMPAREQLGLILRFGVAAGTVGLGAGLFIPFVNVFFANRFDLESDGVGTVMAAGQAMVLVSLMWSRRLADRFGRVPTVVGLQLASVPFLVIMGTTGHLGLAVAAYLFRGAAMQSSNPISTSVMMEHVPPELKGLSNSITSMAFSLSWGISGALSGRIIDAAGYTPVFLMAAVMYVGSSFYYYACFRTLEPATVRTAPAGA